MTNLLYAILTLGSCYLISGLIGSSLHTIYGAEKFSFTKLDIFALHQIRALISPLLTISFIVISIVTDPGTFYILLPLYIIYYLWHMTFFVYRGLRRKSEGIKFGEEYNKIRREKL